LTTTDADAYRRLDEGLKAHRGDAEAYRRLGGQLEARRHLLDPRYGNRRLFVRERLVPRGLKESAAYKLVYDAEQGKLQGRGGFSAGKMLTLAEAYGTTPDSVVAVLEGGDLEPLPGTPAQAPLARGRHRTPEPPVTGQWLPPLPAETIERSRPYADAIWQRLRELALQGIAEPSGRQLFPDAAADAATWDLRADLLSVPERVWLLAALRAREAAAQERESGTGLAAGSAQLNRTTSHT
jgi:hypothetical protein